MKATSSQSNKRGVSLATLAFVAMLMIGQTAPMEYIRDSTYHQETVSYDTVGLSVAENSQSDVVIDLMSTVSGADGCKMSVLDGQGDDSALFTSPVNGVASFDATMASTAFDYENPLDADGDNTFEFDVRTVCPGNVASSETYYVNVTNTVFGFYGDATASITEDVAANMSVWSPTMMNDTTANCAITAGDDAGNFDINASTCAITVSETASFDHETSPTITLTVAASTAGDLESDTQDVAVSVTDVNEAPVGDLVIAGRRPHNEGETLTATTTTATHDGRGQRRGRHSCYERRQQVTATSTTHEQRRRTSTRLTPPTTATSTIQVWTTHGDRDFDELARRRHRRRGTDTTATATSMTGVDRRRRRRCTVSQQHGDFGRWTTTATDFDPRRRRRRRL